MAEPGEFLGLVARAELRSASGDWAEAAALWGEVTAGNPVKGDYWARLAEARFAVEDYAGARDSYGKVLELGVRAEYRRPHEAELPDLLPGEVAYRTACCAAALGQRDEAIDALAVALSRGFRYLARARDDECWKPWLDDSRLSAIFVGEPTGSRPNFIGETIYFELPHSKVRANAADLFWQTSWPDDYRMWIAPDIYAPPTFAAFSRNDHPALDAILSIREQFPGP
jgi:tetratricopeptide (TPR) repeat protein